MSDMFSFEDMLNFFVEGEGKDEPSPKSKEFPKEQRKRKTFSI
jgi:hypothetical protein